MSASSNKNSGDIDKESWEARIEKLLEKCNQDNGAIMRCLTGDALNNIDGLVHKVGKIEENTQLMRKQLVEHAAKLSKHDDEIKEGKTQRKTLITILGLSSGGLGAMLSKFFSNGGGGN